MALCPTCRGIRPQVGREGEEARSVVRPTGLRCVELCERADVNLAREPLVGVGSVRRRQATSEIEDIVYSLASQGQPNLVGRRDDGSYVPFRDPVWLPPLTHWLDALRADGIFSIELTRSPDDPAVRIVRAWHSGPWRTTAEGQGLTDEEAVARCWMAFRRE